MKWRELSVLYCGHSYNMDVDLVFTSCLLSTASFFTASASELFYLHFFCHAHVSWNFQVLVFTQRVMSEYTILFFLLLIVSATWAIMSLMIAAMLARFKAVSLAENLRLMKEKENVSAL